MGCSIDVVAVQPVDHCNFHCRGCNHAAPLIRPAIHGADEYLSSLSALKRLADVQFVHISGGEPTLHPDLHEFVTQIRIVHPRLRLLSNMWWFPDHMDRVESVLPLVNELIVTVHPESKMPRPQIASALRAIAQQHKIRTTIWEQRAFSLATFSDKANGRRGCSISSCHVLRSDGRLGRCPIMALQPPESASVQFNEQRRLSLLDPRASSQEQLTSWRSSLPPCCQFCNYDRTSIAHWPR